MNSPPITRRAASASQSAGFHELEFSPGELMSWLGIQELATFSRAQLDGKPVGAPFGDPAGVDEQTCFRHASVAEHDRGELAVFARAAIAIDDDLEGV